MGKADLPMFINVRFLEAQLCNFDRFLGMKDVQNYNFFLLPCYSRNENIAFKVEPSQKNAAYARIFLNKLIPFNLNKLIKKMKYLTSAMKKMALKELYINLQ